jgi:hypothetical protein
MSYVVSILVLGAICGLWYFVLQGIGGYRHGCGGCATPKENCHGDGTCEEALP